MAPEPILYVTVVFGVAVNVILVPVPEHIVVAPLMLAVGLGSTVSIKSSDTLGQLPSGSAVALNVTVPPD